VALARRGRSGVNRRGADRRRGQPQRCDAVGRGSYLGGSGDRTPSTVGSPRGGDEGAAGGGSARAGVEGAARTQPDGARPRHRGLTPPPGLRRERAVQAESGARAGPRRGAGRAAARTQCPAPRGGVRPPLRADTALGRVDEPGAAHAGPGAGGPRALPGRGARPPLELRPVERGGQPHCQGRSGECPRTADERLPCQPAPRRIGGADPEQPPPGHCRALGPRRRELHALVRVAGPTTNSTSA
jgi:hypothetical protein